MENREENRARDEQLDERINRLVAGHPTEGPKGTRAEKVAQEFARLTSEESPRMSNAARTQGLVALRAGAGRKRAEKRPNPLAFLFGFPRWVQLGLVAVVVVLIANGVSSAAADALPGSLLYPFKRFGEGGQLLLQNTNGQRAQLWMNLANTRLDEIQRLLASGGRVDPSALDAIDDSILRALSELAGTRGDERVELLKQLLALSIRQQQVVTQLADNASPADRARFEQTAKLLAGVANYAQSPDAVSGPESNPFQFLTPSPEPSVTPTSGATATPSSTLTRTAVPSATPSPSATLVPATDVPSPTNVPPVKPTQSDQPVPPQGDDNSNSNDNANDNGEDKGGTNDNGGDDKGIANDNGSGDNQNDNGDDHGGTNDNGGSNNDNGGSGGGDNQNDNGGDDNGGNSGGDNQNDNGDENVNDNSGDNQNDNGDEHVNDNGDNENDNGGDNENDNSGDNQNDNGGNENDNGGD